MEKEYPIFDIAGNKLSDIVINCNVKAVKSEELEPEVSSTTDDNTFQEENNHICCICEYNKQSKKKKEEALFNKRCKKLTDNVIKLKSDLLDTQFRLFCLEKRT